MKNPGTPYENEIPFKDVKSFKCNTKFNRTPELIYNRAGQFIFVHLL